MTYTHLSTDELVIIESYFHQNVSISKISRLIGRAHQTVHIVVAFLKFGTLRLIITVATMQIRNAAVEGPLSYPQRNRPRSKKKLYKAG